MPLLPPMLLLPLLLLLLLLLLPYRTQLLPVRTYLYVS
jgi:hypothetical protein